MTATWEPALEKGNSTIIGSFRLNLKRSLRGGSLTSEKAPAFPATASTTASQRGHRQR